MSPYGPSCPVCAAPLGPPQGDVIVCGVCRSVLGRVTAPEPESEPEPEPAPLRPVGSIALAHQRRATMEPMVNALMQRYIAEMTAGRRAEALRLMEAVVYLTVWTTYECDDLDELAPHADPAVERAAAELGVAYRSPAERGEPVRWARVRALIGAGDGGAKEPK